jgi:hypothetical protein
MIQLARPAASVSPVAFRSQRWPGCALQTIKILGMTADLAACAPPRVLSTLAHEDHHDHGLDPSPAPADRRRGKP